MDGEISQPDDDDKEREVIGDNEVKEDIDKVLDEMIKRENGEKSDDKGAFEAVIKQSPSDIELMSGSEDDAEEDIQDSDEVQIKDEVESDEDYNLSGSPSDDDDDNSVWAESSDEEKEDKKVVRKKVQNRTANVQPVGIKRKAPSPPKPTKAKRPRGRPKQPRRLKIPEGAPDDYTSEEDDEGMKLKPVLRPGSGYPIEFKLKVLKYAETHSNAATAEKFGLQPKRIRDWKNAKYKINDESKGVWKRRPRSDGYTVEEKLQAVIFANEHSKDEARLLYNVDRRTIEKWKAKKDQLEARILQGEGNFIRRGGSGRKPRFLQIEENLRDWIVALRLKGVTLNYKMILNKAKIIMEEDKNTQNLPELPVPRTRTWVIGFLKRQNLHGLLGNTLGHEDPQELLNVELKTGEEDMKSLAEKSVEIPENPNKRNRRTISLEDKVNIIRRIEQGETQGTVAKSLKVATSTIQTIWSCKNEILHKYVNPKSKTKSDALLWKSYSAIGAALHDWLEQSVPKTMKVDCSFLMEKAIQLSETYRLPQFISESKQWLRIFCKKHNLPDVLSELRGNYSSGGGGSATTSTSLNYQQPPHSQPLPAIPNQANNSVDSSNQQGDDFQSDFNFNDFLSSMHIEPQGRQHANSIQQPSQQSSQQPVLSQQLTVHHTSPSSENLSNHRFHTSCTTGTNPAVTTPDALKYIMLLRNYIHTNFGQHEETLNNHLSVVENAVLKKRMNDLEHANNHTHFNLK